MTKIKFKLVGLTCPACVKLSTMRFQKITGVKDVAIDLASGDTEITSEIDIDREVFAQSLADTNFSISK